MTNDLNDEDDSDEHVELVVEQFETDNAYDENGEDFDADKFNRESLFN